VLRFAMEKIGFFVGGDRLIVTEPIAGLAPHI
jgi:hypothetical protein